jgi:hypothetical protein
MHLVYLDEVKHERGREPYYWVCGLAFPEDAILDAEKRLSAIAKDYFGNAMLAKETEFHAVHIVHRKGAFKKHEPDRRLALYASLLDTIDECPGLKRIEVRIEPGRMITRDHAPKAFMFFVEKVNDLMRTLKSVALLIADHDKEMVATNVASLSAWKHRGTSYHFGTEINFVVDTIHHTHSHHSRLIQLADVYTYTRALLPKPELKYLSAKVVEYARSKGNLYPSKVKHWPTEDSWLSA